MAVPPKFLQAVAAASKKYGVPADLLAAQIQGESGWRPDAKSPAGALGISQFMPGTAKGYGIDPMDPIASIDAQGKMMGNLLKSYKGNVALALAGYNAGAGAVADAGGKVPNFPETQKYIKNVQGYRKNYPGLAKGTVPAGDTKLPLPDGTESTVAPPAGPSLLPITDVGASASRGGQAVSGLPTPGGFMEAALQTLGVKRHSSLGAQEARTSASAAQPQSLLPLPDGTPSTVANPTMMDKAAGPTKSNSTIVDAATKFLGTPYLWGGTTAKGLDCSGLVQLAVKNATGKTIPRVAQDQYDASTKIPADQMQPGDVIGFGTKTNVHHIGIYMGNGKFIDAPHTGAKVRVESLKGRSDIVGAGRY